MTASLPSLADSLIQALHQPGQERLLDLVRNPLRLTLLCITWDGTLPETQAQLYENYLKKFYDWNQNLQELRDCAERCQTNITALKKQLNRQLGELAKAALDLPQERFRLSQALVEKYLGEELDDQSLCYLALQLGWLNRVGKDNRGQFIFAFYHATFQAYFAALAVEDWDYFLPRNHVNFPVAGKEYRIFEPQWKQVILLWLGRGDVANEEKEGFIDKLVNFEDGCGEWNFYKADRGFYEYRAYFLAAISIAELNDYSIANKIVENIVNWACSFTSVTIKITWSFEKDYCPKFFPSIASGARDILLKIKLNKAIAALEKVLDKESTQNSETCWAAAGILLEICPENTIAFNSAKKLLNNHNFIKHQHFFSVALMQARIDKIARKNKILADLINSSYQKSEKTLLKFKPDRQIKIKAFMEELAHTQNKGVDEEVALVQLLANTHDYDSRREVVEILGKIAIGNETVINTLLELLGKTLDEDLRRRVIEILGKISTGDEAVINTLLKLLGKTREEGTRRKIAESLGKIASSNTVTLPKINEVISAFNELLRVPKSKYEGREVADSLGQIAIFLGENLPRDKRGLPNCNQVVNTLEELLNTTQDYLTRWKVTDQLKKFSEIVDFDYLVLRLTGWRKRLSNAIYNMRYISQQFGNSEALFKEYYELIWHCAANLPYPDFYRAWHGLNETQTLNLAQLPQLLQTQLTETNLHQTLQLLCIDGSKFDNRDNPATDIYLQLVKKHHCPKSTEGTPRTLTELKIYWQLLDWEKHPILIFYEEAKPQGFSQTFLDFLDRFDATICVITDSPHPTIPTFSPPDPHLIQNIMNWVQRTILEG